MNKPTQISLANPLSIKQSTSNAAQPTIDLDGQTLNAKNIVFAKGAVQLDILVDDHWQTLRLATQSASSSIQKIAAAQITLSNDGKELTIIPKQTSVALNQIKQLHSLLNFVTTGDQVHSQPLSVNVMTQPVAKLQLPQLNANLPINKEIAQLLQSEQPLQALIKGDQKKLTLNVVNRFADTLHQQPISQQKLTLWLAKLIPKGELQAGKNSAQLTIPQHKNTFDIALKTEQFSRLSATAQPVKITAINDQLIIKASNTPYTALLKNSLSETFNNLIKNNQATPLSQASTSNPVFSNPLMNASSPIKSWLHSSFSDLKTRISDAVRYFENKPFSQVTTAHSQQSKLPAPPNKIISPAEQAISLIPKSVRQINLAALANTHIDPLQADISKGSALPKQFHSSAPLVQFFQQIKASLNTLTTQNDSNVVKHDSTNSSTFATTVNPKYVSKFDFIKNNSTLNNILTQVPTDTSAIKGPLTSPPLPSQVLLPIESKLLATLLNTPKGTETFSSSIKNNDEALLTKQSLSQKIEQLAQPKVADNIDLNRLVNQAFNRMISPQSLQPITVQREILSLIAPNSLTDSSYQNSFTQAIENLSVAILAAPSLGSMSALSFNSQNPVDALLQVLVPNFKATNSEKLQEQLQQTSSQTLATELGQIKSTISQVTTPPPNQQIDNNALVQFFLPMRLPPEVSQTEISLGQYKKPTKDKPEGKDVWFVRLNFDYADLGQLQITAELMDKALDCKLLASSQQVTAIAHPHLDTLRHKLSAHGLHVGELNLTQGAPQHQAFYHSHAIINIKV